MLTRYTMPSRKLMFAAALAALAAGWLAAWRRARARRLAARPQAQPRELQTWEGEGGGVPLEDGHTAAQVRPEGAAAATHPSRFASAIDA
jgi:hypothetical protein